MNLILIITLLLVYTHCQYESYPHLTTQKVNLYTNLGVRPQNTTFYYPLTNSQNVYARCILNLLQLRNAANYFISFTANCNVNTTIAAINIDTTQAISGVSTLSFGVIAVTDLYKDYIDVVFVGTFLGQIDYVFQNLSNLIESQYINITSAITFQPLQHYYSCHFFSYFQMSFGGSNQYIVLSLLELIDYTNIISLEVFCQSQDNVSRAGLGVIIHKVTNYQYNFSLVSQQTYFWYKGSTGQENNLYVDSIFGSDYQSHCVVGIYFFQFGITVSANITINFTSFSMYTPQLATNQVTFRSICIMQCQVGMFRFSSTFCSNCYQVFKKCTTCNARHCYTCQEGFWTIEDGCTDVLGCISVTNNYTTNSTTCISCNSSENFELANSSCSCVYGFVLDNSTCKSCSSFMVNCQSCSDNSSCDICAVGFNVVTGGCTNISHCLEISNNVSQNVSICIQCDTLLLFQLVEGSCICGSGLYLDTWRCEFCRDVMVRCEDCDNSSNCTSCSTGYATVINGCSDVVGCIQILNNLTSNASICTQCDTSLSFILSNSSCICIQGYTLNSLGTACQSCGSLMVGCQFCTGYSTCISCYVGFNVTNGCTTIIGCLQVSNNFSTSQSTCIRCETPFFQILADNTCTCAVGHITLNEFCTNIPGCISIYTHYSQICLFCDVANNFYLVNGSCHCNEGFALSGLDCQAVCGDGILINQQCDDGNLISNDGCDSVCSIESNFVCSKENNRSVCYYKGTVSLELIQIDKIQNQNQANVTLKILPNNIPVQQLDYQTSTTYSSAISSIIKKATYSEGYLYIFIDFYEDLEGESGQIGLIFSNTSIISSFVSLNISFESKFGNLYLTNYTSLPQETSETSLPQEFFKYLSISSLVLLVICSFTHKMMGIQTIQVFQLVYYLGCLQVSDKKYLETEFLVYSTGSSSFLYGGISENDKYYLYREGFWENYLVLGVWQVGVLMFFGIYFIINLKRKKQNKSGSNQVAKHEKYQKYISNQILFPSFMAFLFHFFLSTLIYFLSKIQASRRTKSLISIEITVLYIAFSFIVFNELFKFLKSKGQIKIKKIRIKKLESEVQQEHQKRFYIPYFLAMTLTYQTLLLNQMFTSQKKTTLIIFMCLFITNILMLIFKNPYRNKCTNLILMFNQVPPMYLVIWLLFFQEQKVGSQSQLTVCIYLIAILVTVLVLALVRAVVEVRSQFVRKKREDKKECLLKKDVYREKPVQYKDNQTKKQEKFRIRNQEDENLKKLKQSLKANFKKEKEFLNR